MDREFTLKDFKDGTRTILIATSVAARGLDIKQIKLVVNYKCPTHMEDYVHRIGRTGRAGTKGTSYTYITLDEEQYAEDLIKALNSAEKEVPIDLTLMDNEYKRKVEAGEIQRKRKSNGHVGRGFDFSQNELKQDRDKRRKAEKQMLGIEDESEEEAEEDQNAGVVSDSLL